MTFYAIRIEECPGFGWQGGPEFDTLVREKQNGRNQRKARREIALHRYICPYTNIPITAARSIKAVHMAMRGMLHTFLHHDHLDDTAADEFFGTGDGSTTTFQLLKTYDPGGGATYERDITKPDVAGELGEALVIKANGVEVFPSVDSTTGEVDFGSSPPAPGAVLTWSGKHFICVRFARDDLPFTIDSKKGGTVFITNGTLELVEELSE